LHPDEQGRLPTALIIGARNLGFAIIQRLLADGWCVAGGARSADTLEKLRAAGADALEVDVIDQASVLRALRAVADRHGRVDLVVNAASPYGGSRSGPFGGGALAAAGPNGFEEWAAMPARGAFAFLSASARFLREQGTPATVVQVTGGSSLRARPGRGLWAAGAFSVRALTQAAALELREHGIHVALLIVDAVIDRSGNGDADSADPDSLAGAIAYLATQSPRAMTHELQVTPALDNWTP
jgi:NAD(P)-dependent dehydrogenase (short-subunit alcohol dehydrogenase family)